MGLSTTYTKTEIDYLLQNLGAESSSGIIEVTYDELVDLKNTSSLILKIKSSISLTVLKFAFKYLFNSCFNFICLLTLKR